eukprot:960425-Pelagomonas_calceolata.AAC.1
MAPEAGRRRCHVCNVPVDKEYASMCSNVRAANAALANPHLLGEPVAAKDHKRHPLKGRSSKKNFRSMMESCLVGEPGHRRRIVLCLKKGLYIREVQEDTLSLFEKEDTNQGLHAWRVFHGTKFVKISLSSRPPIGLNTINVPINSFLAQASFGTVLKLQIHSADAFPPFFYPIRRQGVPGSCPYGGESLAPFLKPRLRCSPLASLFLFLGARSTEAEGL